MPMLLAGDEMGHAQEGNNNGCCQDSPLLWVNWELSKDQCELLACARQLIRLRRENPVFRRRDFFQGRPIHGLEVKDLYWLTPAGTEMADSDWSAGHVQCLGMGLMGDQIEETDEHGRRIIGDSFLILFNADHQPVSFHLGGRAHAVSIGKFWSTPKAPISKAAAWSTWATTCYRAGHSQCCDRNGSRNN